MSNSSRTARHLYPSTSDKPQYVYTFACHETERELCHLELAQLLGTPLKSGEDWLQTSRRVDPDRSPFVSVRLEVGLSGDSVEAIAAQAGQIQLSGATFKVVCLKAGDPFTYEERRDVERQVGRHIKGTAQMKSPEVTLGLIRTEGIWSLGELHEPERAWLTHKQKPYNYSTGLSSRVARALVNMAVPEPDNTVLLDPCCGMGNVLIEALSMGIQVQGSDINPLAIRGARVNLRHYGYDDQLVSIQDMNELSGSYEASILDLPYNVCSVLQEEDRLQMLRSLRRLARRAVIVSTEPLGEQLRLAGWNVLGRAITTKGSFVREVWLCE
ncbi:TRM11 family methyltransferase [Paenibacillus sp. 7541]|uniref:TRM11 family SAM-dependent methyltransferase n=1 Tax=Paenibacillus sp. 7541 TaxID=2026236 RepID=UPI000BA63195|nr:methyltransferase domain-containing protein [Paenibacillus sp. 7541]PAK52892.1 RNA methyltransferase [Paenibacillus sp. 7541]